MNQGINKKEIIELVESLEIDYNEFWILSTSALVLRGMYDKAGDLDIAVTKKALEQLKSKYNLIPKGNGWYKINDKVECVLDTKEESKFEKYGKYNLESLEKYLNWLEKSNKEKDKIKYDIIKKHLKKKEVTKMNKLKFYKEKETETIIASIEEPDREKYTELVPNTKDAAKEKHVPVYEIKNDEIFVKVGQLQHPMEEEHYIAFIALINGHDITKVDLKPNDKPEATFKYIKGSEIYAYCNKHDLWKTEVK